MSDSTTPKKLNFEQDGQAAAEQNSSPGPEPKDQLAQKEHDGAPSSRGLDLAQNLMHFNGAQYVSMNPKNCLNKGDQFGISLRRKKRTAKLNQKRMRVHGELTKAKFLGRSVRGKVQYTDVLTLRSLISSLSTMIRLPLSDKSVYAVADIIQILREIEHMTKEWESEPKLLEFLHTDDEVQQVFMELLCRDFEVVDPSKVEPEQVNLTLVWQLSKSELMSILSQTSTIISNLANSNQFAESLSHNYDLLSMMRVLLHKYIMDTDLFRIEDAAANNDQETFLQIAGLTEDLVFLTNNFMVDELNDRRSRPPVALDDSMDVLGGLDQLYIRLITGFKAYETTLMEQQQTDPSKQPPILPCKFWDTFSWGMQLLSQGLKSHVKIKELLSHALQQLADQKVPESQLEAAAQQLDQKASEYYLPSLIFARDHVPRIHAQKKEKLKTIGDPKERQRYQKTMRETRVEHCRLLRNCVACFDEKDHLAAIYQPPIEDLVFEQFRTYHPQTQNLCNCIIGQNIAMSDDSVAEHYVKERGLLDILNQSLVKGALEQRRDALWNLGNIALVPACADAIMQCPNGIFDRIVDNYTTVNQVTCRAEASATLVNLCTHCTLDDNFLEKLQTNELFGKINHVLLGVTHKHVATALCSIQMLNVCFERKIASPRQFQHVYSLDAIDSLYVQATTGQELLAAAIEEFMVKHYDCKVQEMEVESDDDHADLGDVSQQPAGSTCADSQINQSDTFEKGDLEQQKSEQGSKIFQI